MSARKHHYVPRFYLGGFTVDGTPDGQLFVVDQRSGRTWKSSPAGCAHERDFYRIEGPDVPPDAFEADLSRIESNAAAVVRETVESLQPPTGEKLRHLITFTTLMAVRTRAMRSHWGRQEGELLRRLMEIGISNPKGFETLKARAEEEGHPFKDDETPEKLLDALANSEIRFPSSWGVKRLLEHAEILYPMLAARSWSLFVPESGAGHFICSDMPAVVHDPTPRPPWAGPSFVDPDSEFSMPLSRGVMLFGRFEAESATYRISGKSVAAMNSRTGMYASQLYAPSEDFTWLRRDDTVGTVADLLKAIAERPLDGDEAGEETP
jgi:hypothetical protein